MASVALYVVGPVVVPLLLGAIVIGVGVARDSEPSGFGEPESGLVPGAVTVTAWSRWDVSLVPEGFGPGDPGHASPRSLVDAMVADARAEHAEPWIRGTIVSEDADAAAARVYLPVPEYPATIAAELFLRLAPGSNGWNVENANVRLHCQRTVRDSFYCGG